MNDDELDEQRPILKRPWVWITTALVIVAAVLLAMVFFPSDDDSSESPGSLAPPESSERLPMPSTAPDGGDVDDLGRPVVVPSQRRGVALDQTERTSSASDANPLARPTGLQWQRVYGAPAPFSRSDGPRTIGDDGIPTGMSRTPQGAAIAALQIASRMRFGPEADRYAIIDQRIAGASAADKQGLRDDGDILSITIDTPELGDVAANMVLVPAAFRVRTGHWSENAATVDIAYGPHEQTNPDDENDVQSVYYWQSLSTGWVDGEWHLKFKPSLLTHDEKEGSGGSLGGGEWARWVQ